MTEEYYEQQGWLEELCGTEPDPLTEEDLIELDLSLRCLYHGISVNECNCRGDE